MTEGDDPRGSRSKASQDVPMIPYEQRREALLGLFFLFLFLFCRNTLDRRESRKEDISIYLTYRYRKNIYTYIDVDNIYVIYIHI